MRIEYINTFIEFSCDVLTEILQDKVTQENFYLQNSLVPLNGIVVIIKLFGQVEGRMLINMTEKTALKVAKIMNMKESNKFDDNVKSAITELANIMSGRIVTELDRLGFNFEISPPKCLVGKKIKVNSPRLEVFIACLKSFYGKININIAFKEKYD